MSGAKDARSLGVNVASLFMVKRCENLGSREGIGIKSKRYATEEKVRILRETSSGKTVLEVCRKPNA